MQDSTDNEAQTKASHKLDRRFILKTEETRNAIQILVRMCRYEKTTEAQDACIEAFLTRHPEFRC